MKISYLLAQSESVFGNFGWLIGGLVVLVAAVFYYRKVKKDQLELEAAEHDAYSHVVNDSNYNIAREGIDNHRTEGLNKAEAREAVEEFKENPEIPSREEYHAVKEGLKS